LKLTDYLAIYGAALSTAVFIWNTSRARPKIKVRIAFAVDTIDGVTDHGIGVSVQNPSAHTAHITSVSFVYPWRRTTVRERFEHLVRFKRLPFRIGWCHSVLSNYSVDDRCPTSIEPGKSHWIFVPDAVLQQLLDDAIKRTFVVQVQDALWRNKTSKPFAYDVPKK